LDGVEDESEEDSEDDMFEREPGLKKKGELNTDAYDLDEDEDERRERTEDPPTPPMSEPEDIPHGKALAKSENYDVESEEEMEESSEESIEEDGRATVALQVKRHQSITHVPLFLN